MSLPIHGGVCSPRMLWQSGVSSKSKEVRMRLGVLRGLSRIASFTVAVGGAIIPSGCSHRVAQAPAEPSPGWSQTA